MRTKKRTLRRKSGAQGGPRFPVTQIEQLLRYWEQIMEWESLRAFPKHIHGAYANFANFRAFCRSAREEIPFDNQRFAETSKGGALHQNASMARGIYSWCQHSRRVYHLSEDLQLLLATTKLGNMRWGDVKFPFPSFAITLEKPMVIGTHKFDALLWGPIEDSVGEKLIQISFISQDLPEFTKPFGDILRSFAREIPRDRGGAIGRADTQISSLRKRTKNHQHGCITWYLPISLDPEMRLVDLLSQVSDQMTLGSEMAEFERLLTHGLQLVYGLPVYLSSFDQAGGGGGNTAVPFKRIITNAENRGAVYEDAQVATVSSHLKFSRQERDMLRRFLADPTAVREGVPLFTHFRSAYWRRPPGKGADPMAKKSIWVKSTIVRPDRLKEGETPGGSQHTHS